MSGTNGDRPPEAYDFQEPDAGFDLRQGLRLLILIVVAVVIVTLVCTYAARR